MMTLIVGDMLQINLIIYNNHIQIQLRLNVRKATREIPTQAKVTAANSKCRALISLIMTSLRLLDSSFISFGKCIQRECRYGSGPRQQACGYETFDRLL